MIPIAEISDASERISWCCSISSRATEQFLPIARRLPIDAHVIIPLTSLPLVITGNWEKSLVSIWVTASSNLVSGDTERGLRAEEASLLIRYIGSAYAGCGPFSSTFSLFMHITPYSAISFPAVQTHNKQKSLRGFGGRLPDGRQLPPLAE